MNTHKATSDYLRRAIRALDRNEVTEALRFISLAEIRLDQAMVDENTTIFGGNCVNTNCPCNATREWLAAPANPDRWNVVPISSIAGGHDELGLPL